MSEQQYIDFGTKKKYIDNRKIGVAFVCFEDQLMNSSSDLRFSVSTLNWRNVQQALRMGDYGGSLNPAALIERLQILKDDISMKSLNESQHIDDLILKHYDFEDGTQLLERLEKIAIAAQYAKTNIRIMTGKFLGSV